MRLYNLHSDINEDWSKAARNFAIGGALGLGLHYSTLPGKKINKPAPETPQRAEPQAELEPRAEPQHTDNLYNHCRNFIPKNEGIRNEVYKDSEGIPTIGIGFNLQRSDAKRMLSSLGYDYDQLLSGRSKLSDEDMWKLFDNDLRSAISDAGRLVSNFDRLPDSARLVIVDMVFNLGPSRFSKFRKAIRAFERLDFGTAADEMVNSRWYHQVGDRSKRNVGIIRGLSKVVGEGF
jgi:GH24 family phage-related lysozyme (muramidase)